MIWQTVLCHSKEYWCLGKRFITKVGVTCLPMIGKTIRIWWKWGVKGQNWWQTIKRLEWDKRDR